MIQSAISLGVSIEILLIPHRITTFFTDDGKGKSMVHHRTFSTRSPPMPKFNAFIWAKYSFHTFMPPPMESPNRRVLGFESLILKFRFIKTLYWN